METYIVAAAISLVGGWLLKILYDVVANKRNGNSKKITICPLSQEGIVGSVNEMKQTLSVFISTWTTYAEFMRNRHTNTDQSAQDISGAAKHISDVKNKLYQDHEEAIRVYATQNALLKQIAESSSKTNDLLLEVIKSVKNGNK